MVAVSNTNCVKQAEDILAESVGRRFAVLTGRGTAALMIACRLVPDDRPRVIIPVMVCANVMYAVLYAGKIPVFADVSPHDATIDPNHVAALLAADPGIGAVIAAHLYGHRADIDALSISTRRHGAYLIEDAAQAQGGRHPDGRIFGAAGDMSVISFGHTKILDVGGGGVLLLDDSDLAERARLEATRLPHAPNDTPQTEAQYSRLFYAAWEAYQTDRRFANLFYPLPDQFRPLFVHAATDLQAQSISAALPDLADELAHRQALYKVYRRAFRSIPGVTTFDVDDTAIAPWRFTFRVPGAIRNRLLHAIRKAGHPASAWYPCLSDWTASPTRIDASTITVARTLEQEIVNLWLTRNYGQKSVENLAAMITREMSCDEGQSHSNHEET